MKLASKASLALTDRGARILVASTEIGQGTRTMLAQIVADTLGVPYDAIDVNAADTGDVPDSGPTVASRTCMIVGRILQRCAEEMRARLGRLTPRQYLRAHGPLVITKEYERRPTSRGTTARYRGDAYGSYGWGCDVVEVEVDPRHLAGDADRVHDRSRDRQGDSSDAGEGTDRRRHRAGHRLRAPRGSGDARRPHGERQLTNYIIPTTLDTPAMDVVMLENPYKHGPFGAKGVGEMPIDGPAPAVINALRHAGFDVREIPATPEKIMAQLGQQRTSARAKIRSVSDGKARGWAPRK